MLQLGPSYRCLLFCGLWLALGGHSVLTVYGQQLPPLPQSPLPLTKQNADSSQISETPSRDTQSSSELLAPSDLTPEMIAEIIEIRERLGGGVSESLRGMLPDDEVSALETTTFEPLLRGSPSQQELSITPLQHEFEHQLRLLSSGNSGRDLSRSGQIESTNNGEDVARSNTSLVEHLRSAARHLDLAAAELEDASEFQMADDLRQQARQMRLKARAGHASFR